MTRRELEQATVQLCSDLIRAKSCSGEEAEAAAVVRGAMQRLGYDEIVTDRLGNVIGCLHGSRSGPKVLLDGHIDTVPGRTGCKISPDVVRRLSVHPNVMGIKEASGDIGYAMQIARYLSDDFVMYSGNDDITIPLLSVGASGVISVWANIMPKEVHDMVANWLAGQHDKALAEQLRCLDLINGLFMEVNPIPVKEAMNLMGLKGGYFRMPMYPMTDEHRAKLAKLMREAGLPVREDV